MAENLNTRDDGRLKPTDLGRNWHILQNSVYAVANAQFVLKWFEVNIGSPQVDGIAQDLIYKADNRSVFSRIVEVGIFFRVFINDLEGSFLAQNIDGITPDSKPLLHFALDRLRRSQQGSEIQTGQRLERVQSLG